MIGYVAGEVIYKEERELIVSCAGVGYSISASPSVTESAHVGKPIALYTHLAVKDDALDLYGFMRREELGLFRLLISISGIGPKSALNVLSLADIGTITHAIESGDAAYLTKVSGVGKKLAGKIVLELKEKIGGLGIITGIDPNESEALEALEALGYAPRDTRDIVRVLAKEQATSQDIIRKALQTLGGRS